MALVAAYTWHEYDKSQAVRAALKGYVSEVELAASERRAELLLARARRAEEANAILQQAIIDAEAEQADVRRDFEEFRQTANPDGGPDVTPDLLRILRAD
ncbi:MAG: hypothetical protein AAFO72_05225 [Pseudomonadota bacterium]